MKGRITKGSRKKKAADKALSDSGLEGASVILARVRDNGSPEPVFNLSAPGDSKHRINMKYFSDFLPG